MPLIARALELVESPLYDTLSNFASDREQMFIHPFGSSGFVDPLSGQIRIKDFTETNMIESSYLGDASHRFAIRSVRVALFSHRGEMMPVVSRYYRGAILELLLAGKPYLKAPLWKLADPATMFASRLALEGFSQEERAELIRALRFTFERDVVIEEKMPFYVSVRFDPSFNWRAPNVNAPGSLVVLLEGSLARPLV